MGGTDWRGALCSAARRSVPAKRRGGFVAAVDGRLDTLAVVHGLLDLHQAGPVARTGLGDPLHEYPPGEFAR
ncbi:MAG TPA: hypothetical protein VJT72_16895 [Pseudonocardiaceae bacterium]|nr:hypothetical protein [Pseudonocardiaceae bacterium]